MVAYMNQEKFGKTMATGETWFWSRSRKTLWHKGATSGNIQTVKTIAVDCDADTCSSPLIPPAQHAIPATSAVLSSLSGREGSYMTQAKQSIPTLYDFIKER